MYYYSEYDEIYAEYAPLGKQSPYTQIILIDKDDKVNIIGNSTGKPDNMENIDENIAFIGIEGDKVYCYRNKVKFGKDGMTKAAPPLPFAVGAPAQKTLYLFLIKSRRGKLQKICKGFSGLERSTACRARRRGSQFLTFCTKIGSSGVVKFYHILFLISASEEIFCFCIDMLDCFLRKVML